MRTIETKIYTFEELSPEVQNKVIKQNRHINVEFNDWFEPIIEGQTEVLENLGFENIKIAFSGFYSQGDGASFEANIDVAKWIEKNSPKKYSRILKLLNSNMIEASGKVKRDRWSHYVHENTTSVYVDFYIYGNLGTSAKNVSALLSELEEDIQGTLIGLNKEIYKALETYYDELTSDEEVRETLIVNEYEYTEGGRQVC